MIKLIDYLSVPFLMLHLLLRFYGPKSKICSQDQKNTTIYRSNPFNNTFMQFVHYMIFLPEYRSVFYRRYGRVGLILSIFFPGRKCLYIRTLSSRIGGGVVLNHAHSTEVNAQSIGKNCVIFQNVTIGTNGGSIGPVIGDNCFFGAGCVVLGNIRIGNNVKIGANAIVVKNIPDNSTVVTKGTVIVKQNDKKVNIQI